MKANSVIDRDQKTEQVELLQIELKALAMFTIKNLEI